MQIAVISDLHLGSGGAADLFGHDDSEFLRFLNFLERNFERVVLLGDIWETLTAHSPLAQAHELKKAQAYHREIHERFARPNYQYVFGNHDLVAGRLDGAREEYCLSVDGVNLLFSHGHQGDALIQTARCMSEVGVWLGGWFRRLGLDSLYAYFASLERSRSQGTEDCMVRSWALGEASRRAADVVVTGHTHVPARVEDGSTLFLNSGSCALGEISFLSMDTKAGNYTVHHGY